MIRLVSVVYLLLFLGLAGNASAQEVWSFGADDVSFTKLSGSDWTLEVNQDRILPGTWITRQTTKGWFNIALEPAYQDIPNSPSPLNTEWAFDIADTIPGFSASNFANLTFDRWRDSISRNTQGAIGKPGVLHLLNEDIYIDIMITSWTSISGGGLSYIRAGDPVPEPGSAYLQWSALVALVALRRARGR